MAEVFTLTLSNVFKMLCFIAVGYGMRKFKGFPAVSGTTLSMLVTYVFSAAYNINSLSRDFTIDNVGQKLIILGFGVLFVLVTTLVGFLVSKPFGKDLQTKRTLTYAFAYTNYGYFGLPVIENVFGPEVLADVIVFTIPLAFAINIFGYWLLTGAKNFKWSTFLLSPVVWSPILGSVLGLSGVKLPTFATEILEVLAGCMSPVAMILLGFVMGSLTLRQLFGYPKAYLLSLIRLVAIPLVMGTILYVCGLRGIYYLLPMLIFSMPIGSNIVVFPESRGVDTSNNAKLVFVSYILAIPLLPLVFSVISMLSGI